MTLSGFWGSLEGKMVIGVGVTFIVLLILAAIVFGYVPFWLALLVLLMIALGVGPLSEMVGSKYTKQITTLGKYAAIPLTILFFGSLFHHPTTYQPVAVQTTTVPAATETATTIQGCAVLCNNTSSTPSKTGVVSSSCPNAKSFHLQSGQTSDIINPGGQHRLCIDRRYGTIALHDIRDTWQTYHDAPFTGWVDKIKAVDGPAGGYYGYFN